MTLALTDYLAVGMFSLVGGWLGSFLPGYLSRKGENRAMHEDIQKLVGQAKATTQATETIKAELTGKLWVSQERWRFKSDLYISLLTLLDTMANDSAYVVKRLRGEKVLRDREIADPTREIQKIVVVAQILNPNRFRLLRELPAATNVLKEGETDIEHAERLGQLYRKLYLDVGAESRRDLGLENFVQ